MQNSIEIQRIDDDQRNKAIDSLENQENSSNEKDEAINHGDPIASCSTSAIEMEVLLTQKGKHLINYRGFKYLKEKSTVTKIYWCCQEKTNGCKGRLQTTFSADGKYNFIKCTDDEKHLDSPSAVSGDVNRFINDKKKKPVMSQQKFLV